MEWIIAIFVISGLLIGRLISINRRQRKEKKILAEYGRMNGLRYSIVVDCEKESSGKLFVDLACAKSSILSPYLQEKIIQHFRRRIESHDGFVEIYLSIGSLPDAIRDFVNQLFHLAFLSLSGEFWGNLIFIIIIDRERRNGLAEIEATLKDTGSVKYTLEAYKVAAESLRAFMAADLGEDPDEGYKSRLEGELKRLECLAI